MIIYNTQDSPEANGREPQKGDVMYSFYFVLDNGDVVKIQMGEKGFSAHTDLLLDMLSNAPEHDDGSVKHNAGEGVAFISSGNTEQDEAEALRIVQTEERLAHGCCPNGCGPMAKISDSEHECGKCHFHWFH